MQMQYLGVSYCGGMLPQYMRVRFESGVEREYMWTAESEQDRRWRLPENGHIYKMTKRFSNRLSALYDRQEVL